MVDRQSDTGIPRAMLLAWIKHFEYSLNHVKVNPEGSVSQHLILMDMVYFILFLVLKTVTANNFMKMYLFCTNKSILYTFNMDSLHIWLYGISTYLVN